MGGFRNYPGHLALVTFRGQGMGPFSTLFCSGTVMTLWGGGRPCGFGLQ